MDQVTFNQGAPIDVNDLNKLQTNINTVLAQSSLTNTTVAGLKTIPSINSDTLTFTSVKAGKLSSKPLPKFTGEPQITLTAQKPSKAVDGVQITLMVDKSTNPYTAYLSTNKDLDTVYVDWISVEMKPVS